MGADPGSEGCVYKRNPSGGSKVDLIQDEIGLHHSFAIDATSESSFGVARETLDLAPKVAPPNSEVRAGSYRVRLLSCAQNCEELDGIKKRKSQSSSLPRLLMSSCNVVFLDWHSSVLSRMNEL